MRAYNPTTQQIEAVERPYSTQLHGKRLGIMVQMPQEEDNQWPKAELYTFFDADTHMVANEILNQHREATQLPKILNYIARKPLLDKRKGAHQIHDVLSTYQPAPAYATAATEAPASTLPPPAKRNTPDSHEVFDDLGDDIIQK